MYPRERNSPEEAKLSWGNYQPRFYRSCSAILVKYATPLTPPSANNIQIMIQKYIENMALKNNGRSRVIFEGLEIQQSVVIAKNIVINCK